MNLVGNAMKFTERGTIGIKAKQLENDGKYSKIYFEVKDNGPGIPDSKKKVIFEEFSQLNNSNYNYQGTGLGLPIVKRLLRLFDSRIRLDSKEGEGATFSFTISFKIDTSKQEKPLIKAEVNNGSNSYIKILEVDDNRINQVVTERVLKLWFVYTAIAVVALVGLSRVFLGVHWPTDILAGWSAGIGWFCLSRLIMGRLLFSVN